MNRSVSLRKIRGFIRSVQLAFSSKMKTTIRAGSVSGAATLRNIRVNVAMSVGLKAVFLAMALGGVATLWMAVLADTGASILVVANALRLLRAR